MHNNSNNNNEQSHLYWPGAVSGQCADLVTALENMPRSPAQHWDPQPCPSPRAPPVIFTCPQGQEAIQTSAGTPASRGKQSGLSSRQHNSISMFWSWEQGANWISIPYLLSSPTWSHRQLQHPPPSAPVSPHQPPSAQVCVPSPGPHVPQVTRRAGARDRGTQMGV